MGTFFCFLLREEYRKVPYQIFLGRRRRSVPYQIFFGKRNRSKRRRSGGTGGRGRVGVTEPERVLKTLHVTSCTNGRREVFYSDDVIRD
jgi:hypothetical protein